MPRPRLIVHDHCISRCERVYSPIMAFTDHPGSENGDEGGKARRRGVTGWSASAGVRNDHLRFVSGWILVPCDAY